MSGLWTYLTLHDRVIWDWTVTTIWLAALPLFTGLGLALPVGWLASNVRWTYSPLVGIASLLYTIPSLVMFLVLPGLLGTTILDPLNVAVALTVYVFALMTRTVADALSSVPPELLSSSEAMGHTAVQRFSSVQLPLAVPVIAAGLRVAAVSNVSLISVASIIGVSQLGQLFAIGSSTDSATPIVLGLILFVLLATAFDLVILGVARTLTPWRRGATS